MDTVILSRIQFAVTTLFRIPFPSLTIGRSVFLVVVEALWLRTREELYYPHALPPDITFYDAAAEPATLRLTLRGDVHHGRYVRETPIRNGMEGTGSGR